MEKVIKVNNLEETIALGNRLGLLLQPNMLLTLSGDLGAGKTTFTKGIGQGLGITKVINSPTFTILKQYQGRLNLSHFDAYRLEGQDDDLGFEEIFDSDDVCVVEWANFIEDILPVDRLTIEIKKIDENIREFVFKTNNSFHLIFNLFFS
mgnify:FL=1